MVCLYNHVYHEIFISWKKSALYVKCSCEKTYRKEKFAFKETLAQTVFNFQKSISQRNVSKKIKREKMTWDKKLMI